MRELHRPSTGATLNLAAVAAQGARLYRDYDPSFADRLLAAGRVAWGRGDGESRALPPRGRRQLRGGPDDASGVTDEFYWAAVELYLTTGEPAFADAVTGSPLHQAAVFDTDGFDWGHVAALGRLDLATVPSTLRGIDRVSRSPGPQPVLWLLHHRVRRRVSQNQHSRWHADQLNDELPNPPNGAIACGPNTSIQDPVAQELLRGCLPQFCYIDDVNSRSTNELTINWNSTLSWFASFGADQDDG
ncbi:MAG: glycoside hydrolase family 9 protein [Acidimicrobiales bacterium]